jgi:uncharacterized protein YbjT (DUF2867 family)
MNAENPSRVLVVGGTGTVGGAALRALLARGAHVHALVRSERSALALPRAEHLESVPVDLLDEASLRAALKDVQTAFYVSPHEPNEEQLAETFISACEAQQVRVVFVGVHIHGATPLTRALRRWLYGRFLPHYRPKFRIAERARVSRTNPVVLIPSNFFQNDELFRHDLLEGTFMQPFERPINRVDVRDVADAAARACLDPSLAAGAYSVVGPQSLDAVTCAQVWSQELGSLVQYPGVDPARLNAALARVLTGTKLADFQATYGVLSKFEAPTEASQLAATRALLGRAPTPYTSYVRDTIRAWRSAALAAQ